MDNRFGSERIESWLPRRAHRGDGQCCHNRSTSDRNEHRRWTRVDLLESSDHKRSENCAHAADAEQHSDSRRSKVCLVRRRGEVVQHILCSDDEKSCRRGAD